MADDTLLAVPVIDISPLFDETKDRSTLYKELSDACSTWGFFYVKNNNVPSSLVQEFRKANVDFFNKPKEELYRIKRTQDNSRGYFDDELTKQKLDWKECFDFGAQNGSLDATGRDGYNQWLDNDVCFKETMTKYFNTMEELSIILMQAIAASLDLPPETFEQYFNNGHTSYLRLNYYRKCPNPEENMAVHHHTDAGALTILLQDEGVQSLQVQLKDDNRWYDIPPKPNTFVINIGDMMQVWTNDRYKAPLHRVKATSVSERYSAPFFYNPAYATDVFPIVLLPNEASLYKTLNWGDFRAARFAGDYADAGEEVQISHYRLENK